MNLKNQDMKNITLNAATVDGFMGTLRKLIASNGSMIFPDTGTDTKSSKFGNLRKISRENPHKLTTKRVKIFLSKNFITIKNPLNKNFGYAEVDIPFGNITFAYGSFFWRDQYGIWRQMKFSKEPGWALKLSDGITTPYLGN